VPEGRRHMLNVGRKSSLASLTLRTSIHRPLQTRRESKSSPQMFMTQ
jgi:hypothetical protein